MRILYSASFNANTDSWLFVAGGAASRLSGLTRERLRIIENQPIQRVSLPGPKAKRLRILKSEIRQQGSGHSNALFGVGEKRPGSSALIMSQTGW